MNVDGMATFSILLSIIMLIFGILQIILFFKVWGMTNDVRKLKEELLTPTNQKSIARAILKNDPNLENILFDAVFQYLWGECYAEGTSFGNMEQFKKIYKKLNIPFPAVFEKIKENFYEFHQEVTEAINPQDPIATSTTENV